jgi:histidyl-tRNA synthetase
MLDTIRRNFERFGFLPIETPVMEVQRHPADQAGRRDRAPGLFRSVDRYP